MNKPELRLEKGEQFFRNGLPLYVNRVKEWFDLPEHRHDFIEICYVWSGSGFHYIGEETLRVSRGDLFFLPVGVSHIFRPASPGSRDPLIVGNCIFDESIFRFLTAVLPGEYGLYRFRRLAVAEPPQWLRLRERGDEFGRLFEALHAEYEGKRTGFETMLCGLLLQLLIGMERAMEPKPEPDGADDDARTAAAAPAARRAEAALRYMRERLHERLTLAEVARHVGTSGRQLQRLLAARTQLSFSALLRQARIERSRELLADPAHASLTVADVAARAGLGDLKRFHREFKLATGMTPAQYRRQRAAERG